MNKKQALIVLVSAAQQARLMASDHKAVEQAQQVLIDELGLKAELEEASEPQPEENGE